jgi:hypothetical protein
MQSTQEFIVKKDLVSALAIAFASASIASINDLSRGMNGGTSREMPQVEINRGDENDDF